MEGLAEHGREEQVTEADYNYAVAHCESGSKRPVQPIWRPAAPTALRGY